MTIIIKQKERETVKSTQGYVTGIWQSWNWPKPFAPESLMLNCCVTYAAVDKAERI